jgi:hypothetical protein
LAATIIITSTIELYQRQFGGIYAVFVILLAITLLVLNNKLKFVKKKQKPWDTMHAIAFWLMSGFFVIQALRGILFYQNQGTTYWVIFGWAIFFACIGLLSFVLTHNNLPLLNRNKLSFVICISSLIFFIVYITGGYFTENVLHISRNFPRDLQHLLTSDTTQVAFLFVITLPAAIFLLKTKKQTLSYKIIALLSFVTAFVYAYYWQSRFATLIVACFVITSFGILMSRRFIWILLIPIVFLFVDYKYITAIPKQMGINIVSMIRPSETAGNWDRSSAILKSFSLISEHPTSTLLGFGTNAYKVKLSQTFAPGLAVIVLDSGLLGLTLLLINFAATGRRIVIQKNNPGKTLLLLSLGLTGAFLLAGQSFTNILFYFLIMPNGLLIQLCARSKQKSTK